MITAKELLSSTDTLCAVDEGFVKLTRLALIKDADEYLLSFYPKKITHGNWIAADEALYSRFEIPRWKSVILGPTEHEAELISCVELGIIAMEREYNTRYHTNAKWLD